MKFDIHMHTMYSKHWFLGIDALNMPEEMVRAAIRKGLDGIAVTDHDNIKGGLKAKAAARRIDKDFKVITGTEIGSKDGHVLGLGINENVRPGLSVEETVEKIRDLGGVSVAAHPYAKFLFITCLEKKATKTDAIEILNACSCRRFQNRRAEKLAKKFKKPGTAASDAHSVRTLGLAGIIFNGDPLDAIKKGKMKLFGDIAPKREFIYITSKKYGRSIKWKFKGGPKLEK